jgi:hypothetical protein
MVKNASSSSSLNTLTSGSVKFLSFTVMSPFAGIELKNVTKELVYAKALVGCGTFAATLVD